METDPSGLQMQGGSISGADQQMMQDLQRRLQADPQNAQLQQRMGLLMGLMGNRNHVNGPTAAWARAAMLLAQTDEGMTQDRLVEILGAMPVPPANPRPDSDDIVDTRAQSSLQLPLYGMDGNRLGAEAAGESRDMVVQMGGHVGTDLALQGATAVGAGPVARALDYIIRNGGGRLVQSGTRLLLRVGGREIPVANLARRLVAQVTREAGGARRIASVRARIRPENLFGGARPTDAARQLVQAGDDAGHILANMLGGGGETTNIMSQLRALNRGEFRTFERLVADQVAAGREVVVNVRLSYPNNSTSLRPSRIHYEVTVDGTAWPVRMFEN